MPERYCLLHSERAVENCKTDYLRLCDVWPVPHLSRRMKKCPHSVGNTALFPFAGENPRPFVRQRMRMRRNRPARVKLPQDHNAAGRLVTMKDLQLDARIGTGLPRYFVGQRDVRKHCSMNAKRGFPASLDALRISGLLHETRLPLKVSQPFPDDGSDNLLLLLRSIFLNRAPPVKADVSFRPIL